MLCPQQPIKFVSGCVFQALQINKGLPSRTAVTMGVAPKSATTASAASAPGALQLLPGPVPNCPPAGFRNIGSFVNPSGSLCGTVYANLNGDVVGRLSGKIERLSGLLGCMGNLGNFGNCGLSLPFSIQFGKGTIRAVPSRNSAHGIKCRTWIHGLGYGAEK